MTESKDKNQETNPAPKEQRVHAFHRLSSEVLEASKREMPKLNGNQMEFVMLYAEKGFRDEADCYREAYGYKGKYAQTYAWEMLANNPKIRAAVDILISKVLKGSVHTARASLELPAKTLLDIMTNPDAKPTARVLAADAYRKLMTPLNQRMIEEYGADGTISLNINLSSKQAPQSSDTDSK